MVILENGDEMKEIQNNVNEKDKFMNNVLNQIGLDSLNNGELDKFKSCMEMAYMEGAKLRKQYESNNCDSNMSDNINKLNDDLKSLNINMENENENENENGNVIELNNNDLDIIESIENSMLEDDELKNILIRIELEYNNSNDGILDKNININENNKYLSENEKIEIWNKNVDIWNEIIDNNVLDDRNISLLYDCYHNCINMENKKEIIFNKIDDKFSGKNSNTNEKDIVLNENENNLINNSIVDDIDNKNESISPDIDYVDRLSFPTDFSNFADDCTLEMIPMDYKCRLTNQIKYNYRKSLQIAVNKFYDFTRYNQLIIAKAKCSTISFSRKTKFNAYVYKLDGNSLELIHSGTHAPQQCKHNERLQYTDGLNRLDENYKKHWLKQW